jgi:hypothetical protein
MEAGVTRVAPACLKSLAGRLRLSIKETAIFCHARRSTTGHRRLVVVEAFAPDENPSVSVLDPGSFSNPPTVVMDTSYDGTRDFGWLVGPILKSTRKSRFVVYAGQPDASDESHFTFRYTSGEQGTGTIHGWLLDNDKVRFRTLDGPLALPLDYYLEREPRWEANAPSQ